MVRRMNVLVVANDGDGDDGFVGERLSQLGATFDRRLREEPDSLAAAEAAADLVVLLGSDWSVHDEGVASCTDAEIELVRRVVSKGVPLLGICFGAQLSAAAFGCVVERAPAAEIGWRTIESDDPSLCGVGPWFQYHADRWIDSGPVKSFMRNRVGPQAFVLGRTLGVQFHPEVTASTASRWLRAAPNEVHATGMSINVIEEQSVNLIADARRRCFDLVDRFLAEVATRPPAPLVELAG